MVILMDTRRYPLPHKFPFGYKFRDPILGEFLKKIGDESVAVRKVALTALSSALHSMPGLLRNVMDELIPLLYKETEFKVFIFNNFIYDRLSWCKLFKWGRFNIKLIMAWIIGR